MNKKYKLFIYIFLYLTTIFTCTYFITSKVVDNYNKNEIQNTINSYVLLSNSTDTSTNSSSKSTDNTNNQTTNSSVETADTSSNESTDNSNTQITESSESTTNSSNESITNDLNIKETVKNEDVYYSNTGTIQKIGVLKINKINLTLPIFKGFIDTEDLMLKGAVQNKDNSKIGEGNYVLSSHIIESANSENLLFGQLHTLEKSDKIQIITDKTYTFTVYNKLTVKSNEIWILNDIENYNILTLYTCYRNENNILDRTVIRAVLTNVQ